MEEAFRGETREEEERKKRRESAPESAELCAT
jgi:hypothetical protein